MWLAVTPTRLVNLERVTEITAVQVNAVWRIEAHCDTGKLYLYECKTEKAAAKMIRKILRSLVNGN